jgi:hypothetical protein
LLNSFTDQANVYFTDPQLNTISLKNEFNATLLNFLIGGYSHTIFDISDDGSRFWSITFNTSDGQVLYLQQPLFSIRKDGVVTFERCVLVNLGSAAGVAIFNITGSVYGVFAQSHLNVYWGKDTVEVFHVHSDTTFCIETSFVV